MKHMTQLDKNIAFNLKRIRKSKNMSLDMLAERTGVSKSMLGQIERGVSNPTVSTIGKIVDGLKVPFEQLIYDRQEFMVMPSLEEAPVFRAKEGAEDDEALGAEDLKKIGFGSKDVLVGIAASGRTPYVLGAMNYARQQGAHVIGISCNPGSQVEKTAEIAITPTPGPEVVTGSTRMKSGTAQKMVLNMLSTGAMIKLGKVYGNLMVDVKPTNAKLVERCKRIVCEATGVDYDTATEALEKCGYRAKVAIVMLKTGSDVHEAEQRLEAHEGRVAQAVGEN